MEKIIKTEYLYKEYISESDKLLKFIINCVILGGATGFLCVGISSYIQYDIIPLLKSSQIIFFPQGLTMCFYGTCGLLVGINQMRILVANIGEGYNEFDKKEGVMTIYRKGKNSDIKISYPLTDIVRIKIYINL